MRGPGESSGTSSPLQDQKKKGWAETTVIKDAGKKQEYRQIPEAKEDLQHPVPKTKKK